MTKEYKGIYHSLKMVRRDQLGITGLETAIVLIAFVVVAAVFAFVVISAGLLGGQRAKETAVASLGEAKTSLAPKGSVIALQALVTGAHDGAEDAAVLADSAGDFINDGVSAGDKIENLTDGSSATVTAVSPTTVTGVLAGGTEDDWDGGDTYRIGLSNKVDTIQFKLALGAGSQAVGLSSGSTLVSYTDTNNNVNASYASPFPATPVDRVYWNHVWPVNGTSGPSLDSGEVVEFYVNINNITAGVTGSSTLGPNELFNIQVLPSGGSPIAISRTTPLELKPIMDLN